MTKLIKVKEYTYDVVSFQLISKETTQIMLRPSTDVHLNYQAGQYIKIVHPNGDVSPLSVANAPGEDFLIELQLSHPLVNSPAQDILSYIAKEKRLILRGPYGYCTTDELYTEQPIIFLARGTGFSPVKAIIEEMIKFKKYPQMHFYWSVTSPDEFYMDELLMQWTREIDNFVYTPVLSRPDVKWKGKVGLLQDVILEDYPDMTKYLVYASAPPSVVYNVLHQIQKAGLPRNHYYSDVFDYNPYE